MFWLLIGCWQPPTTQPPAPLQVEASDVLEGTADEITPGAELPDGPAAADGEVADGDEAADGDADAGGPEVPEAPDPPAAPPAVDVEPWLGHTVGSPLTLVDDVGAVVQVVRGGPVAVRVLQEGPDRVKVRCEGCLPVVEGWLQKSAVSQ
jgi:hypothetical protein